MTTTFDFGAAIKHRLEQLGLSYDEAGRSIGKYHQWLSFLLERKSEPKGVIEIEKLCRILSKKGSLARTKSTAKDLPVIEIPDFDELDMGRYLGFIFQYFGLKRSLSEQFTRAYNYEGIQNLYDSLPEGSTIWVITPRMSQTYSPEMAEYAAKMMVEKKFHFVYFVLENDYKWRTAKKNIELAFNSIDCDEKPDLRNRLRIVGISGSVPMFPTLITQPESPSRRALSAFSGWGTVNVRFVEQDSKMTERLFAGYDQLLDFATLELADSESEEAPTGVEQQTGITVKRFFPASMSATEDSKRVLEPV